MGPVLPQEARSASSGDLLSERGFRLLAESVHDYAVFLLDPGGKIATWNPGAQLIYGYTSDEILSRPFAVFYPQRDIDSSKPQRNLEVAAQAGRCEEEGWGVRKDGGRFWASVVITPLRAPDGALIGFGAICRDLTERRETEQRFRLLVEGVTDYAIFSLDSRGFVTSWNSGAERIKGYSAQEIIGQHFSRFYTPEDRHSALPQRVLASAESEGHFEGEGWRVRKDGTRFWASVVVTAIRDEQGNLTGFSKVTRDISDRQRLLETIRRHAEELELRIAEREQTTAELEAFSYSVSHDLRAPLRAIRGFTEALVEDCAPQLDSTGRAYLDEILAATGRMHRLIEDLLNYSRLSRVALEFTPVAVSDSAAEVLAAMGKEARYVRTDIPASMAVLAHRPTLVQVLFNLISNGIKFHQPGAEPSVVVSATPSPAGMCTITVRDSGIGIAPQHQERVFNVFERLHEAEQYPGTGIGLAIVKRGIERMGGRVRLESEPGRGSTFFLDLPSVTEEHAGS